MAVGTIILAAGMGSRMKSDLPKVLHKVAHAPLVVHAMQSASITEPSKTVIVTGHGADLVESELKAYADDLEFVRQTEQLGTGHAVAQAKANFADFDGDVIILYGDTPFIKGETLQHMIEVRRKGYAVVVLGFEAKTPGKYGRLVQNDAGELERIVEAKDASAEELAISFCNSGVVCAEAKQLFELIDLLDDQNAAKEFYLTDIVKHARDRNLPCMAVSCDEVETQGVNSRNDLAAAERSFQQSRREALMTEGVTLQDPESVYLAYDTVIGRDVVIGPHIVFGPEVTIETGAEIRAFSHLEGCHVSAGAQIGPFARLRPGAEISENARVGNFCEVKNAQIEEGAKVNHLTYIGDARVGKRANIGAGTITCNYDGVMKHHTDIGEDAFIGSNSSLVAPVAIGKGALVGSGSVITMDVPDEALAVARSKQANKEGLAKRIFERLRALKAQKAKG